MSRSTAQSVASGGFLVFLLLGVFPLIQWFAFGRPSGLIGLLFGRPGEPWVWVLPLVLAAIGLAVMWYFGDRTEKQA